MNRTYTVFTILFLLFSESASSCKNQDGKYLELSLDSSQYVAKPDTSKTAQPSFFNKKGVHPRLFCSTRSGSKCDEDGRWFSAENFAKYLVNYKPVHCYKQEHVLEVKSGIETRKTRFIVYYAHK